MTALIARLLFSAALGLAFLGSSPALSAQGKGKGGGGGPPADWAIACTGWGGYSVGPIVLMTADGSQHEKLTRFDVRGAARWSPDDQRLVFALKKSFKGNPVGVYTIGVDGGGMTLLAATAGQVSGVDWSPVAAPDGGDKIAFCADGELYVVDSDGTTLQNLTADPMWDADSCFDPSWSPSGDEIVVVTGRGSVWVFDLVGLGGGLAISSVTDVGAGGPLSGPPMWPIQPSWSPLGDRIVLTAADIVAGGTWDIWSIDLTTGAQTLLAYNGRSPDLSADGTQIVFERNGDVWLMLPDGSGQYPLPHDRKQGAANPSWRTLP